MYITYDSQSTKGDLKERKSDDSLQDFLIEKTVTKVEFVFVAPPGSKLEEVVLKNAKIEVCFEKRKSFLTNQFQPFFSEIM